MLFRSSIVIIIALVLVGIFAWYITKSDSADISVRLGPGTIVMDKEALVLTPDESILVEQDVIYLPLRPLMARVGYQVCYDQGLQTSSMRKAEETVLMIIGSNDYVRNNKTIVLENPPILVKGQIMVPITFLSKVLGKTVEIQK